MAEFPRRPLLGNSVSKKHPVVYRKGSFLLHSSRLSSSQTHNPPSPTNPAPCDDSPVYPTDRQIRTALQHWIKLLFENPNSRTLFCDPLQRALGPVG